MNHTTADCTLTLCDGTHYDLNPLGSAKSDYIAKVGKLEYKLNVCRGVVSELWHVDQPEKVGGFVSRESGDFSLGQYNTSLFLSHTHDQPMIFLQNGSPCKHNPSELASTAIRFICRPDVFEAGSPELIAAFPPGAHEEACHFVFDWPTHVACPQSAKKKLEAGHFAAFFGILLVVVLTWFLGHTLYNRFFLKKSGMAVFPIPSSLPHIGRFGGRQSSGSGPAWGSGRRSSRGGYQGLRPDEYDETENFASRYSLEDDDEDLTGGNEAARPLSNEANVWSGAKTNGAGLANGQAQNGTGVHRGMEHL